MNFNSNILVTLNKAVSALVMVSIIGLYANIPVYFAYAEETETDATPASTSIESIPTVESSAPDSDAAVSNPITEVVAPLVSTDTVATEPLTLNKISATAAVTNFDNGCDADLTETMIVSDGTDITSSGNAHVIVRNPAWVNITGAQWIWSEDPITTPADQAVTEDFTKHITLGGTVHNAALMIAADNNFTVSVNGSDAGAMTTGDDNYASAANYSLLPSLFHNGDNTLDIAVTNTAYYDGDVNPAGLSYKLMICSEPATISITLNGSNPMNVVQGSTFIDPGATATDTDDTAITISTSTVPVGGVDTSTLGTYVITYTATSASGLSTSTTRTVNVVPGDECDMATTTLVSDVTTTVDGNPSALTWVSTDWTASIPGAQWIWKDAQVQQPTQEETYMFTKTFNVAGSIDSASLEIAADNTYLVTLNGHTIAQNDTEFNFRSSDQATVSVPPAFFVAGTNTLTFTIKNFALADSDYILNPAGLLYKFSYHGSSCGTVTPPVAPTITLIGSNPINLTVGDTFVDPGAEATTTVNGDILGPIVVTGDSVSTSTPGTYTIIYTVTDTTNGLSASTTRQVIVASAPSNPGNPGNPGGSPSSSSGSFSGGSSSGGLALTIANSCPLIRTFMKLGDNNDTTEVIKLQTFLSTIEHLNVNVTGVFDTTTDTAVRAFQAKYLSDVMGPWNATAPSGYVYITTKKKINEIACNAAIALTTDEAAIIAAHNALNAENANGVGPATTGSETTPVASSTESTSTPADQTIGSTIGANIANTASVINTGIFQRIINFFKNLF